LSTTPTPLTRSFTHIYLEYFPFKNPKQPEYIYTFIMKSFKSIAALTLLFAMVSAKHNGALRRMDIDAHHRDIAERRNPDPQSDQNNTPDILGLGNGDGGNGTGCVSVSLFDP
jgi:hypothetical protein